MVVFSPSWVIGATKEMIGLPGRRDLHKIEDPSNGRRAERPPTGVDGRSGRPKAVAGLDGVARSLCSPAVDRHGVVGVVGDLDDSGRCYGLLPRNRWIGGG